MTKDLFITAFVAMFGVCALIAYVLTSMRDLLLAVNTQLGILILYAEHKDPTLVLRIQSGMKVDGRVK